MALFDLEERFRDVLLDLREQQALASSLDGECTQFASLLSASLRTFAWMEGERNAVIEAVARGLLKPGLTPIAGIGVSNADTAQELAREGEFGVDPRASIKSCHLNP